MKSSIRNWFGIWCVAFSLMSVVTAQETGWEFVERVELQERIDGNYIFDKTTLSPDGTRIAWIEQEGLCLHHLSRTVTTCHDWTC